MKKNKLLTILAVVLLCLSLIASIFIDDNIGSRITEVVTVITAIIGAIALFIQFKKDKEINKANFLMQYDKSFYSDYALTEFFNELDNCVIDSNYKFDYKKYKMDVVKYLEWLESIASLFERKIIDLYMVDNLLAYRFFVIMNNTQVQENELIPYSKWYRGCFYLYDKWYSYEKKRGIVIPKEETALHLQKDYQKIIDDMKSKIK